MITPTSPRETVPSPDPVDQERPRTTRGSRAQRVALTMAAATAGAGALAVVLVGVGAINRNERVTTVVREVTTLASTGSARALYARTAPGVVDVTAHVVVQEQTPFGPRTLEATQTGTGVVVDAQGRILTAEHVVENASSITVTFQDGRASKAKLLGKDAASDIALLQVDAAGLTLHPLALGSVRSLRVGDPLFLVGDPFGYARSLSTGVVSALDRTIVAPNGFTVAHVIQTDTAMNPGNSGGPLLDASGHVVGLADQIATGGSQDTTNTGVGFAVPIDVAKAALQQLERGVTPVHAFLGVAATDATGSGGRSGALVQSVRAGSPAAAAGLKVGDLVVAVGASRVEGAGDLVAAVAAHAPGDRVTLTLLRGARQLSLDVTLARQPTEVASG